MNSWLIEHVCLGDTADNVPRVVDFTVFSDNFKKFAAEFFEIEPAEVLEPYDFYQIYTKEKTEILMEKYDVYKTNRKGEVQEEKDIFKKIPLGVVTLHKNIAKAGSLDAWLDSHPMYREQYEMNYRLVMEEGIPQDIVELIAYTYNNASRDYNQTEVEAFLKEHHISQFIDDLPQLFGRGVRKEIDESFFESW